jgi:hypothetical protein
MKISRALTVLAFLLAAPTVHAQTGFSVVFARQADAPVRIVSLKQTLTDLIAEVNVKNFSDKPVASYTVGWVMWFAEGCARTTMKPVVTVAPDEELPIPAGETRSSGHYRVWLKRALDLAHQHDAMLLSIQVGIVSVSFADGSSWHFDLAGKELFEAFQRDEDSKRCVSSPADGNSPTVKNPDRY